MPFGKTVGNIEMCKHEKKHNRAPDAHIANVV